MRGIVCLIVLSVIFLALGMGCATTANQQSPTKERVATMVGGYPNGYQDWANTVSKVVMDKASPFYGFQRVLVEDDALLVYKNGGQYPVGSRLVLEFNEPMKEDLAKGSTNWIAVMTKDSTGGSTATGGWIFEAYDGASKMKKEMNVVAGCFNCHTAVKHKDYVFSSK